MKSVLFVIAFLVFSHNVFALEVDTFKIIKVYGEIHKQKANQPLKRGDVFTDNDVLVYKGPNSKALVINRHKGRMIIKPKPGKNSETLFLQPISNTTPRNVSFDIKKLLGIDFLLIDDKEIEVPEGKYPLDDNNFFYVQYIYNDEVINKKLRFSENHVIFNRNEIFMVDNSPIEYDEITQMKLFYRKNYQSTLIHSFKLITPDIDELKDEILVISKTLSSRPKDERIDAIHTYLQDVYGKIKRAETKEFIEKNKIN